MEKPKNTTINTFLNCPICSGDLSLDNNYYQCLRCNENFIINSDGQPDFRLINKKTVSLDFRLGEVFSFSKIDLNVLKERKNIEIDFAEIKVPWHLTKELMSYFPKAKNSESLMLDLGCGRAIHKEVCEHAGFRYIGIDYISSNATLLADAHALPFKEESFEFLLSIAVLEHLQYPFVALKEAYRVLKPGGMFIGTVAFLEPFHSNSYYHHSHLGTLNSLCYAGFDVQIIAPSTDWTVIEAQSQMALFEGMKLKYSKWIFKPIKSFYHFWWKRKGYSFLERTIKTSGAFTFIAKKRD